MHIENEVTEPNVGIDGNFEHIQIMSQAPENEIDDSSDSEDEAYTDRVLNLLDFVRIAIDNYYFLCFLIFMFWRI